VRGDAALHGARRVVAPLGEFPRALPCAARLRNRLLRAGAACTSLAGPPCAFARSHGRGLNLHVSKMTQQQTSRTTWPPNQIKISAVEVLTSRRS
jgi:hypothetical protein